MKKLTDNKQVEIFDRIKGKIKSRNLEEFRMQVTEELQKELIGYDFEESIRFSILTTMNFMQYLVENGGWVNEKTTQALWH